MLLLNRSLQISTRRSGNPAYHRHGTLETNSIDQFSYNAQTLAHGLATDADSSIQLSVGASADFDIK